MKLTWSRTAIGRQTKPYDFSAADGAEPVGRIYRHDTSGGPPNTRRLFPWTSTKCRTAAFS